MRVPPAVHDDVFPSKKESNSLSGSCAAWLGAPLNKSEQLSDWGRRPLSASQIAYAANDAHCLTRIFAEMHRRLLAAGLPPRWWAPLLERIP
ncbi:ribonuclease H-like domain-containing protein [Tribonema minus]|uniref:Ribonuclease H-like domain-containing protein n=1 Tax=Tribonema minus TaxID=303371 RepID=A0A836CGK4_9STRA|nr:ribonuclease H-like domain-containing protein [Tribonema minus]